MTMTLSLITAFVVYVLIGLFAPIWALDRRYARLSILLSYMIYVPFMYIALFVVIVSAVITDHCRAVIRRA